MNINPELLQRFNCACATYSYSWAYYQDLLHKQEESVTEKTFQKTALRSHMSPYQCNSTDHTVEKNVEGIQIITRRNANNANDDDDDDDDGPVMYTSRRGKAPAPTPRQYTKADSIVLDEEDDGLESMLSNLTLRDVAKSIVTTATSPPKVRSSSTPPKITARLMQSSEDEQEEVEGLTLSVRKKVNTKTIASNKKTANQLREGEIDPRTGRVFVIEDPETPSTLVSSSSSLPSASTFRSKKHREELTASLFCEYNQAVFQNRLPADMKIEWDAHKRTTAGMTYMKRMTVPASTKEDGSDGLSIAYVARIELSLKVVDSPFRLAQTLLHELCHAAAWVLDHIDKPPHGPAFAKWAARASKSYPKRAVTVCHNFEIKYKFQYQCQRCGTSIGRFSKSIKETDRCARGGCMGRLELVIPQSAIKALRGGGGSGGGSAGDGSTVAQPPLRTPSAYQTFCSKNRPKVVAANPGLNQRDVMKELARLWQEEKKSMATPAQQRGPAEDGFEEHDEIVIDLFSSEDAPLPATSVCTVDEEDEAIEIIE
jgi:hypothetical protein